MEKCFLCQVSGAIRICLPMFSSDLTDVKFHVFYAGCRVWSSDIVSLIRNRAWGGLWLLSSASIARHLISFQLGFCTICPTSLFLGDFTECLRTICLNDADRPLQTAHFFISLQLLITDNLLPSVTSNLCIFHLDVKTKLVLLCTSNFPNKQFYHLKLEHKHVYQTAQWYCVAQGNLRY